MPSYDAIIIGGGSNGLAAAGRLAKAGRKLLVLESAGQPGGGAMQIGFTGPVLFTALNRDRYWLNVLHLLAAFAFYSGVGYGTAIGLGQVRPPHQLHGAATVESWAHFTGRKDDRHVLRRDGQRLVTAGVDPHLNDDEPRGDIGERTAGDQPVRGPGADTDLPRPDRNRCAL